MRVTTLGFLAAATMFLSSVTVWSLTEPRKESWDKTAEKPKTALKLNTDGGQFESGGALRLEGRLGHAHLEAGRSQDTFVLLNVRADQADRQAALPLNVAIALDRSGSMRGQPLSNALAAARTLIERMREGDSIALVAYHARAEVVVPPTTIDPNSRERVLRALSDIRADGDTCISCALTSATELVRGRNGITRVLLLSDGQPTTGVSSIDGLRSIARTAEQSGVTVTTIGVDVDYNERLMTAIAQDSNGHHYFAENPQSLSSIFDQELTGLMKSTARRAELTLELEPGIELEQVFDREFSRNGRTLRVSLGDFRAGEEKTLLLKVRVPSAERGTQAIVAARLEYEDAVTLEKVESKGTLAARIDDEPASALDALVRARLQRTETASTLTEANRLFNEGRADEAKSALQRRLTALRADKELALKSAPKARAPRLSSDFDRQEAALDSAVQGFAVPPPVAATGAGSSAAGVPAAAAPAREGKAQVKRNQAEALEFGF